MVNNRVKPFSPEVVAEAAKLHNVTENNICCICLKPIKVMVFKNTGVCSELHRKDRDNDHLPFRGGHLAP